MYFNEIKKDIIPHEILVNLQKKEIIDKKYKIPNQGEIFNPIDIPFSDKFFNKYFKESIVCGEELLYTYPMYISSSGRNFPLKNITKNFISLEAFSLYYAKSIKFNKALHEEILHLIKWADENNAITCGLSEFVISKKWEDLRKLKENGGTVGKFDTTELL